MAEQTCTSNPNRLPLFRVTRGATLKGSQVELLGTPDDKPLDELKPNDRLWVREFLHYRAPESRRRSGSKHRVAEHRAGVAHEARGRELGRDFTEAEAAEYERATKLRVAQHIVEHRAESINNRLTQMAGRLERAAEDIRRPVASGQSLDQKVYQAQHDLGWLFPNLGAEQLTTDLGGWLQMDAEIRRLGGSSAEAES